MPPQLGAFAIPYPAQHKSRTAASAEVVEVGTSYQHQPAAGPSRIHGNGVDDPAKKDKRRKEMVGKVVGRELNDRRDEIVGRHYAELIGELHHASIQLSMHPDTLPAYNLRLYPLSLERSALLAQLVFQEKHGVEVIQTAYDEERERVEEEWQKGRERIRERLLEGIEERRRRAREEKESDGPAAAAQQTRRRDLATLHAALRRRPGAGSLGAIPAGPITSGPFLNPHSLAVDELPSPFPLPLTSTHLSHTSGYAYGAGAAAVGNGKRRARGGGREAQALGGLGKSLMLLNTVKDQDVEHDLMEIRRGNKRRRVAATTVGAKG
ncbi:uncharacterized protein B0H18DRAFT_1208091 [Fomitopsis serialis]|uniref:uncharacterized protein n=1 Tax=Fomitopsis serialis TaxID=139415 RepID=UPI0020082BAF|nr:uncharacterized protein B0H18DRAFT_1208091 [Neoantrodia serialis]KAH9933364.1 hypothetical protein B0H18DRAFT_1208091 [Neoantrodia serialis]